MADTIIAPAPDAGSSPTPVAPTTPGAAPESNPYAAATKELVGAGSWDALTPSAAPEPDAEPVGGSEPAEPVAETPAEPVVAAYQGWTLDETNRLHRPDGTFATTEEVTAYNAEAEPAPATEPTAEPQPEPTPAITVELRRRDGSTRTIEVDDPVLADELRTNANDGMRAREFGQLKATYESKLSEIQQFETLLETNPEHVFLTVLPLEKQMSIAVKLIAQHWDQLAPTLVQFDTEPTARLRTAMQTQLDVRDGMAQYNKATAAARQAGALAKATVALIPESIPDTLHEQFLNDAQMDITRAVQSGVSVTPETLPTILAARLQLYGASAPTPVATPTLKVRAAAGSRTPATTLSAALKPTGPKAAAMADVQAQQARLTQAQVARRRAAAVPPSGAGATPTRLPPAPAGQSVKDASAELRKLRSW